MPAQLKTSAVSSSLEAANGRLSRKRKNHNVNDDKEIRRTSKRKISNGTSPRDKRQDLTNRASRSIATVSNSTTDDLQYHQSHEDHVLQQALQDLASSSSMKSPKTQFIFAPRPDWHRAELQPMVEPQSELVHPFSNAIGNLHSHAWSLLEADSEVYRKSVLVSTSHKFLSTIMASGTVSDKVSALTLAIQESPVHNFKALEALMGLASKRNRGQALEALGALVDLLGPGFILPPNRRLRKFESQRGLLGVLQKHRIHQWAASENLPVGLSEAHLVVWAYEDWMKSAYFKIVQLLEVWCNDEIEHSRMKSLDFVYCLLKEKPEQETNLLTLLVSKLEDKDRKISSKASYLLLQLQNTHPAMKLILVKTIEQQILLRPGQNSRAKYNAVSTLNQTILSNRDPKTAETLLAIYFEVFIVLLKKPMVGFGLPSDYHMEKTNKEAATRTNAEHETAEKLVSAVLTGINRAVPFVADDNPILDAHVDTLFQIAHSSNFNTSVQALILIQQLSLRRHVAYDRFYRTLYESLLDPRLMTSSKKSLYLNLVLRSLKADVDSRRVKAFMKRMTQILGLHQAPFACGILYIILQLRCQFPDIRTLFEEPEEDVGIEQAAPRHPIMHRQAERSSRSYDGRKRDPEHSNSQYTCLWELIPFLDHFHPSVSFAASNVLSNQEASATPDMESHSLIRFLDKFVYRNPKNTESTRGVSIMQPLSGSGGVINKLSHATGTTVNNPAFWDKTIDRVAVEDIFFHHYFQQVGKRTRTSFTTHIESQSESDNDEEVWKALASSQPDHRMDEVDDSDLDLDVWDYDDDSDADQSRNSLGEGTGVQDVNESDDSADGNDFKEINRTFSKSPEAETRRAAEDTGSLSTRKLKSLPTFASIDDYAELLALEPES
ncbi:CBF-domain-containing protein [Sodiomyces alkalinus F11]|uniref:CBF-domain-containing protein n=1 Tax=Sodiomyces alkalinus (strain CBS 110278 / VKM F-3762 / F11) TaxID=1314773 RepID=A0A3N2PJV3_SODAK|nr:CBF-domain-containing protein [Sodiomyces alkalinus F11]ROT34807.1 CBF-domain-containing protein [Sodiomyces alkalinus F11]